MFCRQRRTAHSLKGPLAEPHGRPGMVRMNVDRHSIGLKKGASEREARNANFFFFETDLSALLLIAALILELFAVSVK
jgi:hypothetical protein